MGTKMNVAQSLPSKNLPCGRETGTLNENREGGLSVGMLHVSDKGELGF